MSVWNEYDAIMDIREIAVKKLKMFITN